MSGLKKAEIPYQQPETKTLKLSEWDKNLLNEDLSPYFDQILANAEAKYQAQQEKQSTCERAAKSTR